MDGDGARPVRLTTRDECDRSCCDHAPRRNSPLHSGMHPSGASGHSAKRVESARLCSYRHPPPSALRLADQIALSSIYQDSGVVSVESRGVHSTMRLAEMAVVTHSRPPLVNTSQRCIYASPSLRPPDDRPVTCAVQR